AHGPSISFLWVCPAAATSSRGAERSAGGVYHHHWLIPGRGPGEPGLYPLSALTPDPSGRTVADTRILLIGSSDSDALVKILGRPGRSLARIEDPKKLASVGTEHDVIVIESVAPPRTVADMCRELR